MCSCIIKHNLRKKIFNVRKIIYSASQIFSETFLSAVIYFDELAERLKLLSCSTETTGLILPEMVTVEDLVQFLHSHWIVALNKFITIIFKSLVTFQTSTY